MTRLTGRISVLIQPAMIVVMGMLLPYWLRELTDPSGWQRATIIFAFAFACTVLLVPMVKLVADRLHVVDEPDERKVHTVSTPLWGGFAIYVAMIAAIYLVGIYYPRIRWLIMALTLLTFTGMLDDYRGVSALTRLIVQGLATALVIHGDVVLTFLPNTWWGVSLEYALTALWIIGLTNAFNFLDGYDGLAAGLTLVAAFAMGAIGLKVGSLGYAQIAFALAGGCLGFLLFNFKMRSRAEIFLGDGGSTLLGFSIASLAVMGSWAEDQWVSLSIPLIILFAPIYDMFLITVGRIYSGKVHSFREWIEYTGKDHFHHRVVNLLGNARRGVTAIWLLTALVGIDGYILIDSPLSDALLIVGKYVMVFAVLTWVFILRERHEKAVAALGEKQTPSVRLIAGRGVRKEAK
ncbi:MAG: undecaprenyl/decaprenyl-phosphate alpha-N-acetylglucosaminyl 1-phosphate transferase [Nitrospirae bacterium]|nr:undecaprenyl/decaprenyl-phosphate alpha-N-acetylglucosaminyl 1-phosphate transferase [Nitrospirota bacterium]